jgi:hypothetical protein
MRTKLISMFGWLGAWVFWLLSTYRFHPTFSLALITTTSLVCAFAGATYCNHCVYIPRFWSVNKRWQYWVWLAGTMTILTAIALAIIRVSYLRALGPDSDPYGLVKHYAIDLFGMIVHVGIAAWIVRFLNHERHETHETHAKQ